MLIVLLGQEINDVFDDILFAEERVIEKSYEDGFNIGASQGNPDGYHLGFHRGAELGAKLGFYVSVLENYFKELKFQSQYSSEKLNHLNELVALIKDFPKTNVENVDIIELIDSITSKFKRVCVLFKINIKYPDGDKFSF